MSNRTDWSGGDAGNNAETQSGRPQKVNESTTLSNKDSQTYFADEKIRIPEIPDVSTCKLLLFKICIAICHSKFYFKLLFLAGTI